MEVVVGVTMALSLPWRIVVREQRIQGRGDGIVRFQAAEEAVDWLRVGRMMMMRRMVLVRGQRFDLG